MLRGDFKALVNRPKARAVYALVDAPEVEIYARWRRPEIHTWTLVIGLVLDETRVVLANDVRRVASRG